MKKYQIAYIENGITSTALRDIFATEADAQKAIKEWKSNAPAEETGLEKLGVVEIDEVDEE